MCLTGGHPLGSSERSKVDSGCRRLAPEASSPYEPEGPVRFLATGTFSAHELAVKATGLGPGHGGASQMSASRRQSGMVSLSYKDKDVPCGEAGGPAGYTGYAGVSTPSAACAGHGSSAHWSRRSCSEFGLARKGIGWFVFSLRRCVR